MGKEERLWNKNYTKVMVANFMIFFSFMLVAPLLPIYLKERFQTSNDVIGVVLSGYVIMALFSRMFSGYMVDTFPRKKIWVFFFFLFFLFFFGYIVAGTLLAFTFVRVMHGLPFGGVTVANSTVAIDVLPPKRRGEGIGYYGVSNNIATAISPTVALWIYDVTKGYTMIFTLAMIIAGVGMLISMTVELPEREVVLNKAPISLDRLFLIPAWRIALSLMCLSFSYGVVSTYVAIYGQEDLGITGGAGFFFALLSVGLLMSRVFGARLLKRGMVVKNASIGCCVALLGYILFAAGHNVVCYFLAALVIGMGNGFMYPAYQTMFINLAENNQRGTANSTPLVSWDTGVGLGILVGGILSRHYGYTVAFTGAWMVNVVGVVIFFLMVKNYYLIHKLR